MKSLVKPLLLVCALVLVASMLVFVAACGTSTETTTTAALQTTTASAATTTTAAADTTGATADTTGTAAASGTIAFKGLVDKPGSLTVDDLKKMNVVTMTADHPKKGATEYTGVRLSDIFAAVGVQSAATVVDIGATDGYLAEVSLADIKAAADAMIAIGADGTLNAVMPGLAGKAWVSDIVSMELK